MTSSVNLFIAQLDKRVDDHLLRKEFERFGSILSAMVAKDGTGASKGYGFVDFAFQSDGIRAMSEMHGKTILSKTISVDFANTQKDGKYYGGEPKNGTYWANESHWDVKSSSLIDSDDLSDIASQVSDSASDESQISDVKQRMRKLFEGQLYTDVIFYAKGSRKTSVSGHRAILAAGSPLFAQMLFGEGSEKSVGMKMEVQISNLPFDAFKYIVRYLYTDDICFENDALAQAILDGAKQFQIYSLVERCKSHFELQELTEDNVCSKLQMSITNKIEVLKNRCMEYIQKNTKQVINSSDFQRCNSTTIRTICKLQSLNLSSEADLLHAVMRWSNSQNVSDKRQLLEPLLKCLRFLTFTVVEFGDVMKRYPDLLSSDDGLKIMLFLYNPPNTPDSKSLPSWLNKNVMKRCVVRNPNQNTSAWNDSPIGRVVFPLRFNDDSSITQNMTELTSLLQMKCTNGFHQITAIKLAFQAPVSERSVIKTVIIKVHRSPSAFEVSEHIQIVNSLEVRVPLSRVIRVRRGDLIDIEVEAKDIKFYRFLQFDGTSSLPANPHFQCCVSSRPKCGKLYFIKEVEYGPQENTRDNAKSRNNLHKRPNFKGILPC